MTVSRKFIQIEKKNNHFCIQTDGPSIQLWFLTNDIIRIRASFSGKFQEESYALVTTAWEDRLDGFLGSERKKITPIKPQIEEHEDFFSFTTVTCQLRMHKSSFGFSLHHGKESVYSDLLGRAYKQDHLGRIYHYNQLCGDYYYGFGETPGPINKKGQRVRQAPRDSIGYSAREASGPMYKHIPFYIRMNQQSAHAVGLFYHNSYESIFDLGCERSGYWPSYSYFCADGGDIDLFLINGPQISHIVERYTDLTGKSAFLPKYALGYLGSTMYYTELDENCDQEIINFVDKCQREQIPIDNFHLSSGYTACRESRQRNVFTWNYKKFPNPENFFSEMKKRGVEVTSNIKPGILLTNPHYSNFDQAGAFVQASKENKSYTDRWWGGEGSFVDFSNPKAREIWKNLLKEQILERGAFSIWNDNCEYDSLEDYKARCAFDGGDGEIQELKPIQSLIMAKVAHDAFAEIDSQQRPFIVNRSGFAGLQRYASTWSGDNRTSWETLRFNIATMLGMSLSGVANNGSDIGGFCGSRPDAELFVRWVQHGIFQPRFSIHSCNDDNTVTQPWMYQNYTHLICKAIQFRYQLIPYFYSLLYQASTKGLPIVRPLFFEFQNDPKTYDESELFLVGPSLLVASVLEPKAMTKQVYLPDGCDWYYWDTHEKFSGGQSITVDVDISTIPIFVRDNAIIPQDLDCRNIHLDVPSHYHITIGGNDGSFLMLEDDGTSNRYLEGECLKTKIVVTSGEQTKISFQPSGNFSSTIKKITLEVIQAERGPFWVTLNGRKLPYFLQRDQWENAEEGWYYSNTKSAALIRYSSLVTEYDVVISFEEFDLTQM